MTLNNGTTISLTAVTYLKVLHSHERPHQFDIRCRCFPYTTQPPHTHHNHRSQTFFFNPNDPEEIPYNAFYFPLYFATPTPLLKEIPFQPTISLVCLQDNTVITLPRSNLHTASWHHQVLNTTTQEIRCVMLPYDCHMTAV